ncbi:MAG: acetyl-CoA C-acyltransferase [Pseudomonadota bacterium]
MNHEKVVILGAARTPIGALLGDLSTVPAPQLGAVAIKAALGQSQLSSEDIDEVLMGNVLSAGLGQAPARQAALAAKLPQSTPCTTISKVCGSGMKSVMLAYDQIRAGSINTAIAGGMEAMSRAPYLLPNARQGYRFGHSEVLDHMAYDGLQNAYDGQAMGCFADINAKADGLDRAALDEYALESLKRAKTAIEKGYFKQEIAPVMIASRQGEITVDTDEQPGKAKPDKIPQLKPAFAKDGIVTAANASSLSDGAAALVLTTAALASQRGLKPIAEIKAHSTHAQAPEKFTHAPIGAIQALLHKLSWTVDEVDLFEVNEAFAAVAMAAINQLSLAHAHTNIHGGATALGHPIGASGARILVTLLYALKRLGKQRGVASLCIGGGEATAIAIEMC